MNAQIDIEELAPSTGYVIMNGKDADLEAEIAEVIAEASKAIRDTMRIGKLVRVNKNKPCEWKSLGVRLHLVHAVPHASAALGGKNPMNVDEETGLPNIFHAITRLSMSLTRQKMDEYKLEHRLGQVSEIIEE